MKATEAKLPAFLQNSPVFVVVYRAETNFVDIMPQAERLRLSLDMAFDDVNDPKGRCKDATAFGPWGDVEVGLGALDELPYVMGLVRRSFEQQMDDRGQA